MSVPLCVDAYGFDVGVRVFFVVLAPLEGAPRDPDPAV